MLINVHKTMADTSRGGGGK